MRSFLLQLLISAILTASGSLALADLPALDPLARASTRLGPGYIVALDVAINEVSEPELCGLFPLDSEGRLDVTVGFKPLNRIALKGLTSEEARRRVLQEIERYFAAKPTVKLGIAKIPRFDVVVEGATFVNGVVRLLDGARLSDLLAEVNYLPSADLQDVHITRFSAQGGRTTLHANFTRILSAAGTQDDRLNDPPLRNGDLITLRTSVKPAPPPTIVVLGEVSTQGAIPYTANMTVRDALLAAHMKPSADADQLIIRRVRDTPYLVVSPSRALKDEPTENLKLQPDDTLIVMRKDTGNRYSVVGAVPNPQTNDFKQPVTLRQAIMDSGGFKPEADRKAVLLVRNMLSDPAHAETIPVDFDQILRGEHPDIALKPGDMVQVQPRRKQPSPLLNIGLILLRFLMF